MHQKCAGLQLSSNGSPPSCPAPHGGAENAKGIKLLEFCIGGCLKMPLQGKNTEGLKFVLGILATAAAKVARLASA